MSDHNHDNNHDQVEGSGVKAKPILVFLAVLGAATALVYVIILGVEVGLQKFEDMSPQQPATAVQTGTKLPPEPRLQGAPEPNPDKPGDTKSSMLPLEDMAAYRDKVNKQAAAYGWVDQTGGVAHIPIERAKEMIAEKGLPKLSDALIGEYQTAETARKQVLNSGSNSGRSIKSQKQAAPASASEAAKPATVAPTTAPSAVKPAAASAAAGAKH
ncbi:MAG: hypothetical protein AAB401_18505 [Acidobacteriota bacterium]